MSVYYKSLSQGPNAVGAYMIFFVKFEDSEVFWLKFKIKIDRTFNDYFDINRCEMSL